MKLFQIYLSFLFMTFTIPALSQTTLPSNVFETIQASTTITPDDIIYVDFWASWCVPCRKSFPWMNAMHQKYKEQGLHIVAVNVDSDPSLAQAFLKKIPAAFPIVYDPKGALAEAFQLTGMPSSYILNARGEVLSAHKGFFLNKTETYEQELKSLLVQKTPAATE